jgi:membrane protein YqaA with SNARE-associated domain
MFAWAFAEATFWPVVPEFLLVPLAAGNRRRFYIPLLASIIGSALGVAVLYLVAYRQPNATLAYLIRLPLTGHGYGRIAALLTTRGATGYLAQPFSGVPSKVWAVAGGVAGINPTEAVSVLIIARSLRMAVFATLARVLGGVFLESLRDYSLVALAVYLALFGFFWWRVVNS